MEVKMNEKELRQLQTALKGTEGVTLARKAPRQLGLFVDFKGYQYRIDYIEEKGWQTKIGFVEGPDLAELQVLVPVVLKCQQNKEMEAIAEAEAAKTEAEEERKTAIAQAAAEKKKTEELRDYCRLAVVPDFDRQSWCENHFGFGKWHIAELTRQELEILADEIKRRVEDARKAAAVPALYAAIAEGEAVAEEIQAWQKEKAIAPDADQLKDALNKTFKGEGLRAKVLSQNLIEVSFPFCGETFCVSSELGQWQFLAASTRESLSPEAQTVREAVKQALEIFWAEQAEEKARERYGHDCSNYALDENGEILCHGSGPIEFGPEEDEENAIAPKTLTIKGKSLTLKQPWAWAVFNCGKNIENRSWDTSHRGHLFIHAGQTYDHCGAAWIAEKFGVEVPGPGNLPEGAIVGWVEMKGVTRINKLDESPWAIAGQYHWVLKNPQSCEPIPWKGRLGLFEAEIPFPTPPQWILGNSQALWDYGSIEIPNGSPYRPSNGSESDWFMGGWCNQCSKLNICPIPVMSMTGEQPPEWVYWDQKPICLGWEQAIADKPLAYYLYQGLYKVGDAEGNLEEFESAEEAISFINNWRKVSLPAEAKTGKSLAIYQMAEEVTCE
jgi:hypothetical protein